MTVAKEDQGTICSQINQQKESPVNISGWKHIHYCSVIYLPYAIQPAETHPGFLCDSCQRGSGPWNRMKINLSGLSGRCQQAGWQSRKQHTLQQPSFTRHTLPSETVWRQMTSACVCDSVHEAVKKSDKWATDTKVLYSQHSLTAFRVIHQHDFTISFVSHRTILKAM